MITLSKSAKDKIVSLKNKENNILRAGVRGGGCSGFTYFLKFDNSKEVKFCSLIIFFDKLLFLRNS